MTDEAKLRNIEPGSGWVVGEMVTFDDVWYWCSFCATDKPKGESFIGVAIVKSNQMFGVAGAASAAWATKCNPGGECFVMEVPEEYGDPPDEWNHKLITDKARINELTQQWHGCGIVRVPDEEF